MTFLPQVSMDIMREYQIPVPRGFMATDAAQAESLYKAEIGTEVPVVVKAMVLAGYLRTLFSLSFRVELIY